MLQAIDKNGETITPIVGDEFIRLNRGSSNEPFTGKITGVKEDRISVIGGGYIGGCHYGKWWGDLLSTEYLTITSRTYDDELIAECEPMSNEMVAYMRELAKSEDVDFNEKLINED